MKTLTIVFAGIVLSLQVAKAQMSSENRAAFSETQVSYVHHVLPQEPAVTEPETPVTPPAVTKVESTQVSGVVKEAPAAVKVDSDGKAYSESQQFSVNMDEQMFRLKVRSANLQYQIDALKAELEQLKNPQ
jgi:hypothetical protein